MRELVLNHASVLVPERHHDVAIEWVVDLAHAMAAIIRHRIAQNSLRMARFAYEIPCLPDQSLFDIYQLLRAQGHRDEYEFLARLVTKSPLLNEVKEKVRDRFLACEEQKLPAPDGEPLVFCVFTGGIAVGFPSSSEWDKDTLTVHFSELLSDEASEIACDDIDQLTRSEHVVPIVNRYRVQLRANSNPVDLWRERQTIFPHLYFGPGVEDNLKKFSSWFGTIIRKLETLNESAGEWQQEGGDAPPWKTHVTPESIGRMQDERFRATRRFRSHQGTMELFEWHARFGNSGRIHLRFERDSRQVEIGYIGPHLPL